MKRLLAVLCLAAAACGRTEPVEPPPPPKTAGGGFQVEPDIDVDNLLSIARGAVAVSRTGELNLTESALHAADGLPSTTWAMPPGGPSQAATFALAAPARVESLGISVSIKSDLVPQKVRISLSSDGRQWEEAVVIEPKAQMAPQIVPITPRDAQYVRVETEEPSDYHSQIRSIHLIGSETGPFRPASPGGCWEINGSTAQLHIDGARVAGAIGGRTPIQLLGGSDGRIIRVMWLQPPMWGYAIAGTSPDNASLSALTFHEEPFTGYAANAWFGTRCAERLPAAAVVPSAEAFLATAGRWSLFGLAFRANDELVEEPSAGELDQLAALLRAAPQRYRLVSREFRQDTPEANRTKSAARLDALRAALRLRGVDVDRVEAVALGSEWDREPISVTTQFMLMSRIDLEVIRESK